MTIQTYRDFWPYYLDQHRHATTRRIHYVGTASFLALSAAAVATMEPWLLLPAVALFYLPAWLAHFIIEGNRPATWTYPVWSFVSDIRMFGLFLTGRLERQLARPHQPVEAGARAKG
jgi:hypothetical protein